jgi:Tfp pilus assembly pilus retraction ATPase PilT
MGLVELPPLGINTWSHETLSNLISNVLTAASQPLIIVDGIAGSGKTTLAKKLVNALDANLVHTDDVCWGSDPIHWDAEILDGIVTPWRSGNDVSV